MKQALQAANEINARWHACMKLGGAISTGCPTDEEVAEIIRKYFTQKPGTDEDQPD